LLDGDVQKNAIYEKCDDQTSLNFTKYIVALTFMSPNKFIINIYFIINLMIFILYHEC